MAKITKGLDAHGNEIKVGDTVLFVDWDSRQMYSKLKIGKISRFTESKVYIKFVMDYTGVSSGKEYEYSTLTKLVFSMNALQDIDINSIYRNPLR